MTEVKLFDFDFENPEALAAKIYQVDSWLGMEAKVDETERQHMHFCRLKLLSPSGIVIGRLSLTYDKDRKSWWFGGTSGMFPDDWDKLCNL